MTEPAPSRCTGEIRNDTELATDRGPGHACRFRSDWIPLFRAGGSHL